MSKLPEECAELANLERLDLSHNSFISLPHCSFKMPKLRSLKANDNHIIGNIPSPVCRNKLILFDSRCRNRIPYRGTFIGKSRLGEQSTGPSYSRRVVQDHKNYSEFVT